MALEIYSMDQLQTLIRTGELPFGGEGTAAYKTMGVIDSQFTPVGNVGTGEDDLMSYTLPANTLSANGKGIRVTASGLGNGIDNSTLKFHFGSFAYTLHGLTSIEIWWFSALILRSSAGNQRRLYTAHAEPTGVTTSTDGTASQDETGAIIVKFTGENISDASDDAVSQSLMLIEVLN